MGFYELLESLGKKIYNRILEDTSPEDVFLLSIIDPDTFMELQKEVTSNLQEMEKTLKGTGTFRERFLSNNYIAVTIATLQVWLVYDVDYDKVDDSFYRKMKKYYASNLVEDQDVREYFKNIKQEDLWERVRRFFEKEARYLRIPPRKPKGVSGRYTQFPKSQQIIRWNEVIKYADTFRGLKLEPYQILSLGDFCDRVHIDNRYRFKPEEYEAIRKIVFSFYNKWDGRSTTEIKAQRKSVQNRQHGQVMGRSANPEIVIKIENDVMRVFVDDKKKSGKYLFNMFPQKRALPFIFDEYYEDWTEIRKRLKRKDKVLVLINKSYPVGNYFRDHRYDDLKLECFHVYIFDNCNSRIAEFADLKFDNNEIYTIIGGVSGRSSYNANANVLGIWYDFALPKIKINLPPLANVYIDSKEVAVEKNQINLAKCSLPVGWHSFKCKDISPVYFYVAGATANDTVELNSGWLVSSIDMRQIKHDETPSIIGLDVLKPNKATTPMRPFLSQMKYLQKRLSEQRLSRKIQAIETRRYYGY